MEFVCHKMIFLVQLTIVVINLHLHYASAEAGVIFGMSADNLPALKDVVALYKSEQIPLLRLYEAHPDILDALRATGIRVAVGVKNSDIERIAISKDDAMQWVDEHIMPYAMDIKFEIIAVGNDMVPGPGAELVPIAMNNILNSINGFGLINIKVSTVVSAAVLEPAPLPSAGEFTPAAKPLMLGITHWLQASHNPLMINVDSYNAHISNPGKVPLAFATFNSQGYVLVDGEYQYNNQFEVIVDTFYSALERSEGDYIGVVVAETGWPSAGHEPHTSAELAFRYNQGLVDTIRHKGTPRRPNDLLNAFILSMFDENQKPPGVAQNYGVHYANGSKVYDLKFT
ncbi:hypothetical protein vseg_009499 [Gypsophila vaccaria]